MIRVSPEYPCVICGKPDWCLRSPDGKVFICPRTPSDKMIGEAGYLHTLDKAAKKIPYTQILKTQKYPINWDALQALYVSKTTSSDALDKGWDGEADTHPLRLPDTTIVGIQRRFPFGTKGMVKGSKMGLFFSIPYSFTACSDGYTLICEGCSDTLAGLNLGYSSIGRLNCSNGINLIIELIQKQRIKKPIIIADNDAPGVRGAQKLLEKMLTMDIKSGILVPPAGIKDLREWLEKGLNREQLHIKLDNIWQWL